MREDYQDERVARCPADQSRHWKTPVEGTTQKRRASYGTNYYTVAAIGGRGPYNKLSMFRRASSTILLVEIAEEGGFAATDHVHPESWWLNPKSLASQELELDQHLDRSNYGFIDGHVEPLTFDRTFEVKEGTFPPEFVFNKYDPTIAR